MQSQLEQGVIMLSEISQTQKDKYIFLICGSCYTEYETCMDVTPLAI